MLELNTLGIIIDQDGKGLMKKGIISRNIALLMEHFGVRNESQLAKQVSMPQTTINKLITGVSADPRISTLAPIIQHFNISMDTLLSENPIFSDLTKNNAFNFSLIPLINFDEIIDVYENIDSLTTTNWPHWYPIHNPENKKYYAVNLSPDQFPKPFEQSSILIILKDSALLNNTYCINKHLSSNSTSIKKIFFDDGKQWLLALHPELPASEYNKNCKILGTIQFTVNNMLNNNIVHTEKHGGNNE